MIHFKEEADGLISVHVWCYARSDEVLAGHLAIMVDDYWWFCSATKAPALNVMMLDRIQKKLQELNGPLMVADSGKGNA